LKNLFGNEVSKKLFANAKKLDLTGEKNLEKVEFNEETIKLIDKCFEELKKSVSSYYQTAQASKRISDVTKNKLKVLPDCLQNKNRATLSVALFLFIYIFYLIWKPQPVL
jgi:hypothetical protein